MARPRNHVATETLTLSTTPHVIAELEALVDTGHFGKNPAEAAERIVASHLHEIFGSAVNVKPPQRARRPTAAAAKSE